MKRTKLPVTLPGKVGAVCKKRSIVWVRRLSGKAGAGAVVVDNWPDIHDGEEVTVTVAPAKRAKRGGRK